MDQFGIRTLCPAPLDWIEFVGEDTHGNRDGDALGIEIPLAPILPKETGPRKRRVGQPGDDRDVVEDVIARETPRLVKGCKNLNPVKTHIHCWRTSGKRCVPLGGN